MKSSRVVCRCPLRISLGGGGTDLPSYYEKFGSSFLSAAINRYSYVSITPYLPDKIRLNVNDLQADFSSTQHIPPGLISSALTETGLTSFRGAINAFNELPDKSGLGSSASFLVCLLKSLYEMQGQIVEKSLLAHRAFEIEAIKLALPVGKQDQYACAIGGVNHFKITTDGCVSHQPLQINKDTFLKHLCLFYTGTQRRSADLLKQQDQQTRDNQQTMLQNLHSIHELGQLSLKALLAEDFNDYGLLMNEHWQMKKRRSKKMSADLLDRIYQAAIANGAWGGKLIGAGGGGFFLFCCADREQLITAMEKFKVAIIDFDFDVEGVCRIA